MGEIIRVELSDEVQDAIEKTLQSEDPLDRSDFNATEYINRLFPNEIALNGIDDIINKMQVNLTMLPKEMRLTILPL